MGSRVVSGVCMIECCFKTLSPKPLAYSSNCYCFLYLFCGLPQHCFPWQPWTLTQANRHVLQEQLIPPNRVGCCPYFGASLQAGMSIIMASILQRTCLRVHMTPKHFERDLSKFTSSGSHPIMVDRLKLPTVASQRDGHHIIATRKQTSAS